MFSSNILWWIVFLALLAWFSALMLTKRRRIDWLYFFGGMLFGFYFDYLSFTNGYYSYPSFYGVAIAGIPLAMTIAEGFAIVITMDIFERASTFLKIK
jgi:hypothetical protein